MAGIGTDRDPRHDLASQSGRLDSNGTEAGREMPAHAGAGSPLPERDHVIADGRLVAYPGQRS